LVVVVESQHSVALSDPCSSPPLYKRLISLRLEEGDFGGGFAA
jgi:hypothetical protein